MFFDAYPRPILFDLTTIYIFFLVSSVLAIIIVFASLLIINQKSDVEKVSSYECGFDPFDDSRTDKEDSAISLKEQEIEKLKEYKMSLIDSVVTGKVRVC